MSHFEYVSVAYALIYALAVGRLLGGLSPAMDASRRYWVHLIWILLLLLVTVMAWWLGWGSSEVIWTPLRFLLGLSLPALIFLRASVLLGNSNDPPDSYYDHFYETRVHFFSLGATVAVVLIFLPWVYGNTQWFTWSPIHLNAIGLLVISVLGMYSRSATVHAAIAVLSLISIATSFFTIPVAKAAA